jgi:hypothetical protein
MHIAQGCFTLVTGDAVRKFLMNELKEGGSVFFFAPYHQKIGKKK